MPLLLPLRPAGACTDPRAGSAGPSPEDALALAAGAEKAVADALPLDATQVTFCTKMMRRCFSLVKAIQMQPATAGAAASTSASSLVAKAVP